jgi:Cu2+-exporting ATPase
LLQADGYARYYDLLLDSGAHAGRMDNQDPSGDLSDPLLWVARDQSGADAVYVPAMTCAACIWLLEHAVKQESGVAWSRVNLEERILKVGLEPGSDDRSVLKTIIGKLQSYGYPPAPLARKLSFRNYEERRAMMNLGIAAAAFGNVMLFSTSIYFGDVWGIDSGIAVFFNWWSFLITTAALLWPGRVFFQHAWVAVKVRSLHVDLPIAVALTVAWATSVYSLLTGGMLFYWDSISGLVFLLLAGRYVNDRITARAKNLAGAAAGLLPPASAHCRPGEVIAVSPGQNFPADGRIVGGGTTVDESALTGESRAVTKAIGDRVLGGSRNLAGAVSVLVEAAGEGTWIRQLERRIEQAAAERGGIVTLADRVLPWFTVATFLLTVVAGLLWWPSGPAKAVEVMCVILIVSCPCAIALATPLSMTIAFKRAWEHGAIIKSPDALERLADVDAIVIDKTGTLTRGRPVVSDCLSGLHQQPPSREDLRIIWSVMSRSLHPVAVGVAAWLAERVGESSLPDRVEEMVHEIPGQGLLAENPRWIVIAGRGSWVREHLHRYEGSARIEALPPEDQQHAGSVCVVALVRRVGEGRGDVTSTVFQFLLRDDIHEDAAAVIAALRKERQVWLLSGDRPSATADVAALVGIPPEQVIAGATPDMKLNFVKSLAEQGMRVLMVGDGINDAAALAAATVGIAVKGGVDVALHSADAFLTKPGIGLVGSLLDFAGYTRRSLVILMGASIAYNLGAVSLALAGVLHPGIAALIMPLASITVLGLVNLRKGEQVWKSSSSWCPLPSPSQASPSSVSFGVLKTDSSTT